MLQQGLLQQQQAMQMPTSPMSPSSGTRISGGGLAWWLDRGQLFHNEPRSGGKVVGGVGGGKGEAGVSAVGRWNRDGLSRAEEGGRGGRERESSAAKHGQREQQQQEKQQEEQQYYHSSRSVRPCSPVAWMGSQDLEGYSVLNEGGDVPAHVWRSPSEKAPGQQAYSNVQEWQQQQQQQQLSMKQRDNVGSRSEVLVVGGKEGEHPEVLGEGEGGERRERRGQRDKKDRKSKGKDEGRGEGRGYGEAHSSRKLAKELSFRASVDPSASSSLRSNSFYGTSPNPAGNFATDPASPAAANGLASASLPATGRRGEKSTPKSGSGKPSSSTRREASSAVCYTNTPPFTVPPPKISSAASPSAPHLAPTRHQQNDTLTLTPNTLPYPTLTPNATAAVPTATTSNATQPLAHHHHHEHSYSPAAPPSTATASPAASPPPSSYPHTPSTAAAALSPPLSSHSHSVYYTDRTSPPSSHHTTTRTSATTFDHTATHCPPSSRLSHPSSPSIYEGHALARPPTVSSDARPHSSSAKASRHHSSASKARREKQQASAYQEPLSGGSKVREGQQQQQGGGIPEGARPHSAVPCSISKGVSQLGIYTSKPRLRMLQSLLLFSL